jgi:hypothetical protein
MSKPLPATEVNLFHSSWQNIPAKTLLLIEALNAIRTGRYQDEIRILRVILRHEGKAAYDKAKAHLDAFTFGGTFAPRRGNVSLVQHSGLVCGDLDHLDDAEAVKQAIAGDPHTVYVFTSPIGIGLKVGVRVPVVSDDAGYKHAWSHVSQLYGQVYGVAWDPSGKDISRLCFVSHDPTAYWNSDATLAAMAPNGQPQCRPASLRMDGSTIDAKQWLADTHFLVRLEELEKDPQPLGLRPEATGKVA